MTPCRQGHRSQLRVIGGNSVTDIALALLTQVHFSFFSVNERCSCYICRFTFSIESKNNGIETDLVTPVQFSSLCRLRMERVSENCESISCGVE